MKEVQTQLNFQPVSKKKKVKEQVHPNKTSTVNKVEPKVVQTYLQFGQKDFLTTCVLCSMTYYPGVLEDEKLHTGFCTSIVNGITLPKYKTEVSLLSLFNRNGDCKVQGEKGYGPLLVLKTCTKDSTLSGSIVCFQGTQLGKFDRLKLKEICFVLNQSLGATQIEENRFNHSKFYLYLDTKRKVVGCLVAEPIRRSKKILNPKQTLSDAEVNYQLEPQTYPSCIGVNRIWVLPKFRRRKVGWKLLEVVRLHFNGFEAQKEEIAFSQPTLQGRNLAYKFSEGRFINVYEELDLVLY